MLNIVHHVTVQMSQIGSECRFAGMRRGMRDCSYLLGMEKPMCLEWRRAQGGLIEMFKSWMEYIFKNLVKEKLITRRHKVTVIGK